MIGRTREALAKIFFTAQSRLLIMADKSKPENSAFLPFEGIWLMSPAGGIACARIVKGELLIPYSKSGEDKLVGHYFDCRIVDDTLFCRFERFDSNAGGILRLTVGPNHTLQGGWWLNKDVPQENREHISKLPNSMPKMIKTVWVFMPKEKTYPWAEKYFQADPPWTAL
jgi:hypothetical protein